MSRAFDEALQAITHMPIAGVPPLEDIASALAEYRAAKAMAVIAAAYVGGKTKRSTDIS